MDIREAAAPVIQKLYPKTSHMEMTIGILRDGEAQVLHLDPEQNESAEPLLYPVGSICKTFTASLLAKYVQEGKQTSTRRFPNISTAFRSSTILPCADWLYMRPATAGSPSAPWKR